MTALGIIGGVIMGIIAVIFLTLAVAAARTGSDYIRHNDAGAALVCIVTALIVGGFAVFFGAMSLLLFGG